VRAAQSACKCAQSTQQMRRKCAPPQTLVTVRRISRVTMYRHGKSRQSQARSHPASAAPLRCSRGMSRSALARLRRSGVPLRSHRSAPARLRRPGSSGGLLRRWRSAPIRLFRSGSAGGLPRPLRLSTGLSEPPRSLLAYASLASRCSPVPAPRPLPPRTSSPPRRLRPPSGSRACRSAAAPVALSRLWVRWLPDARARAPPSSCGAPSRSEPRCSAGSLLHARLRAVAPRSGLRWRRGAQRCGASRGSRYCSPGRPGSLLCSRSAGGLRPRSQRSPGCWAGGGLPAPALP